MRSTEAKIKALDGKLKSLQDRNQLVTVTFQSGEKRMVRLENVILQMFDHAAGLDDAEIVSVEGDPGPGGGRLMEMIQDLLSPPQSEVLRLLCEIEGREE